LSFVTTAIRPYHLPKSSPVIAFKLSFIKITIRPNVKTYSFFLIVFILAIICLFIFNPNSETISQAIQKGSFVYVTVLPKILTVSRWFSLEIVAKENIPIIKGFLSLTMLEILVELAFVTVPIDPNMNSIAISLAVLPFTKIRVPFYALPDS
jgi:hypothetical protein